MMDKAPVWHSERMWEQSIKPALDSKGEYVFYWGISKETLVATLNWLRSEKDVICKWELSKPGEYKVIITNKEEVKEKMLSISLNELCGEWWFNLGVSYDKTKYTPPYKRVITIGIIFFSIYIRFSKWK